MSTAIINTLALGARDVDVLMGQVRSWQRVVRERAIADCAALLARKATGIFDDAWLRGEDAGHVLARVHNEVEERRERVRVDRIRDPEVDFDFSFVLFRHEAEWYAKAYGEQPAWIDAWREHFGGRPFDYWNNTDRPRSVTASEWERRRLAWETMIGRDSPSERGMLVTADDLDIRPAVEMVVAAQPERPERASRIATARLRAERISPPAEFAFDHFMQVLRNFDLWCATDEGRAALESQSTEIAAALKSRLDEADLLGFRPGRLPQTACEPG
ncbi:hypothetical protein [Defluviimonas salinarum]|uniref:Uncharacterized protein n=1 Tax=Defluviimonas salinarum TaxID=2992147 RepID=A0ABT3J888_9RHOB|nr:hypothetical protein [Defluviimonas salinarum]MCW3783905.1 hypothetical protein [Defluviimonas salinarum]